MIRSLVLFVHVASAMGVAAALAIEGTALLRLRGAVGAEIPAALRGFGYAQRVGGPSLGLIVASGIYLATVYWRWRADWIGIGFASLVLVGVIGATMTGRRIARLRGASIPDRPSDPVLWTSYVLRLAIIVGIVFLMTVKPARGLALAVMAAAIAAGLIVGYTRFQWRTSPLARETARSRP